MSDLNFQSFSNDFGVNSTNEQSGFHGGNLGDRDRNNLVDDNVSTSGAGRNFFSMTYYQQFFDVDTEQVVKRVLNSVIPTNNNFILDFVQPLPDLWGPFWISVTLVFSIGIFGNIAQYIGNTGKGDYGSDFRLVTSASTLIFLYVVFVPVLLFAILWHRKSDLQYPYLDIVCAYGYSLTIFIPVSLLWILNVNWFRWALILTSVTLSGSVLAKAIYPAFKNDSNRLVAFGSVAAVFFLHFLLAFAFKEMFFDAVHPLQTTGAIATPGASQTIGSNITTVLSNVSSSSSPSTIVTPSLPAAAMTSTAAGSTETTDINSPAATSIAVSTASTTTGHPVNNTEANTTKTATKVAESRTTTSATASATNTTTSPPKSSSKSP